MKKKLTLKNGNILYIVQDENPINPRTEWDNLGTMICWHRRYNLGDKESEDYSDSEALFAELAGFSAEDLMQDKETSEHTDEAWKEAHKKVSDAANKNAIILPLYLYDHSGITISTGSFSCPWDSGQVGWIFVTRETLKKEGLSDETDEKIQKYLEGEVETYDQYLTGDVYGFQLKKLVKFEKKNLETGEVEIIEEEENIDSCWGFYGHDFEENGLYDQAGVKREDILEEITV